MEKNKQGCGKILYGNKADGKIVCGDRKSAWIKDKFVKIGSFYCEKCKLNTKKD